MPVEMFPLLPGEYRYVSAEDCVTEAMDFLVEDGPCEIELLWETELLSDEGLWYWQTIRDLMLAGF